MSWPGKGDDKAVFYKVITCKEPFGGLTTEKLVPDANFAPGRGGWRVGIGQEGRCVAAQHRTGKTFEKWQILNPGWAVECFYKRLVYKKFGFKLVNRDVFVGTIAV